MFYTSNLFLKLLISFIYLTSNCGVNLQEAKEIEKKTNDEIFYTLTISKHFWHLR